MNRFLAQRNHIQSAWAQRRIPQAMLFVGTLDCALADFTKQFMHLVFCTNHVTYRGVSAKSIDAESFLKPADMTWGCLECIDCQMVARNEHCDVEWVKPEKSGGAIKIDQIRELQNTAYLTPQRAKHRLIVIESAERMNTAAANSLLKILEEPASHTLFLLIAQQLSTVLPTVLSRCQVVRFAAHEDLSVINLLKLGEYYPEESAQAMIVKESGAILDGLIAVIEKKDHPCIVAAKWTQFELGILLWFFYLVYAQIQTMQINASAASEPAKCQLNKLVSLLSPMMIFAQIDKINTVQRKLSHNMNVNHTLVLEDLLFDLQGD